MLRLAARDTVTARVTKMTAPASPAGYSTMWINDQALWANLGYNQLVEKYLCPAWSQTHVRTLVCEPVHNVGSGNSEKS